MQHSTLVLSLEKSAFQSIRTQLLLLQKKTPDAETPSAAIQAEQSDDLYDNELHAIKFEHFVLTLLNHMNTISKIENKIAPSQLYTQTTSFYLQMSSIIAVFDSVDIDCRGVVAYNDFVDFCLRLGRLLLKPSLKSSFSTYLQYEGNKGSMYPSHKLRYFAPLNTLFVLDTEAPRVRMYKRDGKFLDKVCPIEEAKRLLRHQAINRTTYYEKANYEKEFTALKLTERDFDESKGTVLDCCYIDHLKQVIFSSTHSYLFFMDASVGFKETILTNRRDECYKIQHYLKTNYPLYGLYYSSILDLLVGYPGEGSEHAFEIYEPSTRMLKYQIMKHDAKVLSICEMALDKAHPTKDHYFVSSSLDKRVIMWPTAPMSTMINQSSTKRLLRVADVIDYELRGHNHAIESLAYAPHNEILFGCGFDYEIIAWDPFSRDVCMRFVGHFKSLAGVQISYVPEEKLLSLDESGVLKVWNISKDLGVYGNQESSVTLQCSQPPHIKDFITTYERGKGLAILAEKVYYLNVETDVVDEVKPVANGLGFCPTSGRAFTIFRSTINLFDICSSRKFKKISFLDPDRVTSTDELISSNDEMRMDRPRKPVHNQETSSSSAPNNNKKAKEDDKTLKYFGFVDVKDVITAVAMDGHGKKVFLGTRDGRVLLFDSYTFGLLKQLTSELEDEAFRQQGSVIGLTYVDRDELVVAAYDNGAVKVYSGCLRSAVTVSNVEESSSSTQLPSSANSKSNPTKASFMTGLGESINASKFYGFTGGKAPTQQNLLRECDLGYIHDHSIRTLAVSADHNLIATMTKTGLIFLYDYLTLDFLACLSMEQDDPNILLQQQQQSFTSEHKNEAKALINYLFLEFLPSVPVLLVVDSFHNISAWGVKGMGNRFLLSWNIYDDIEYNNNKDLNFFYNGMDFNNANPVSMGIPNFLSQYNPMISCVKSYTFNSPNADINFSTTLNAIISEGKVATSQQQQQSANNNNNNSPAKKRASFHTKTAGPSTNQNQNHSDQRWMLIIGTEDGLILTQNLTNLLEKSGALEFLAKLDTHYPVYHKIKPRRYKLHSILDHSDFPRQKITEEWEKRILHPMKRYASIHENPVIESIIQKESAHMNSVGSASFSSAVGAPPFMKQNTNSSFQVGGAGGGGFGSMSMSFSAAIAQEPSMVPGGEGGNNNHHAPNLIMMFDKIPKVNKNVAHGAGNRKGMKFLQKLMKKFKLEEKPFQYIEGLYTWHAFHHHPVRCLNFYNPFLDYSLNDLNNSLFQMPTPSAAAAHTTTNPSGNPTTSSFLMTSSIHSHRLTSHIPYSLTCLNNRLPLLSALGDNGNIRFWTFTGVYLGQNHEDETINANGFHDVGGGDEIISYRNRNEDQDPNNIEEDLKALEEKNMKGSMFSEIFTEIKPTTFVTMLEETDENPHHQTHVKGKKKPISAGSKYNLDENVSVAAKIYVKNERTSKIITKRLSVVAKDSLLSSANSSSSAAVMNKLTELPTFQNPLITSTQIMQSFINFNNQITNDTNIYESYSLEDLKFYRKKFGSTSWNFPFIKIQLPIQLNKKDTDKIFPIYQDSCIIQSYIQYKFYLKIILLLLKVIQHDINYLYLDKIGYFNQQIQSNNNSHHSSRLFTANPRQHKLHPSLSYGQPPRLYRKISNYATRYRSMENLLKGIDTYLIKAKAQHDSNYQLLNENKKKGPSSSSPSASSKWSAGKAFSKNDPEKEQEKLKTQEIATKTAQIENMLLYKPHSVQSIYDHDYEEKKKNEQLLKYIISGLTEHEIMLANALQKKTLDKQSKHNLNNLIDYIQENTYFDDDLKNHKSSAFAFQNYEKEKNRTKQLTAQDYGSDRYFQTKLKDLGLTADDLEKLKKESSKKSMNKKSSSRPSSAAAGGGESVTPGSTLPPMISAPASVENLVLGSTLPEFNPSVYTAGGGGLSPKADGILTNSVTDEAFNIIRSSMQEANQGLELAFDPVANEGVVAIDDDDVHGIAVDDLMEEKISLYQQQRTNNNNNNNNTEDHNKPPRPSTAPASTGYNRLHPSNQPPSKTNSPVKNRTPFHDQPQPQPSNELSKRIGGSRPASPSPPSLRNPATMNHNHHEDDKKQHIVRPHSANEIFRHTSIPAAGANTTGTTTLIESPSKRTGVKLEKLDTILDTLDTISLTGIQCENSQTFPMVLSMDEILEKNYEQNINLANIRPLSANHEAPSHLNMFIDHRPMGVAELAATFGINTNENSPSTKDNNDGIVTNPSSPNSFNILINTKNSQTPTSPGGGGGGGGGNNRLLEISQKFEEAIITSKIYSHAFHLYDPLNAKRNTDKEKYSKKLKRKLYLARHKDQYIDESATGGGGDQGNYHSSSSQIQKYCMEDIIDMEKEFKTLEKKRLYIQATAAGEKTTYGYYRIVDIFQFMALTDLLTIVDPQTMNQLLILTGSAASAAGGGGAGGGNDFTTSMNTAANATSTTTATNSSIGASAATTPHSNKKSSKNQEEEKDTRKQLFYFNENGQDFSKIVNHQPFYYIDELLFVLNEFYNHEKNILIKDLLFYRNESPKLPIISLFHLIETFFSQTKSISFHLRIFMFISGSQLLYDLFRNSTTPKDFNKISRVRSRSFDGGDNNDDHENDGTDMADPGVFAVKSGSPKKPFKKTGSTNTLVSKASMRSERVTGEKYGNSMGIVDMKEVDDIDLDDDDDDNDEDNEKPKTPKGSLSKSKSNLKERPASASVLMNRIGSSPKLSKKKSQLQATIVTDKKLNSSASAIDLGMAKTPSRSALKKAVSTVSIADGAAGGESGNEESKSPQKVVRMTDITEQYESKPAGNNSTSNMAAAMRAAVAIASSASNDPVIANTGGEEGNKRRKSVAISSAPVVASRKKSMMFLGTGFSDDEKYSHIPRGMNLRHALLLAPMAGRYVVRPHPTRGFRLWFVKRSQFKKVAKILDLWCEGNIECLNVQDFVEIFYSLVPKADRDNFRIMRNITVSLNRAGIKLIMELNSEILTRILENILEMKIISG